MENNETKQTLTLKILNIKDAESKAGKSYWKVETDKGNYSVFDKPVVEVLMKNKNKFVECETASNDRGFSNIRKATAREEPREESKSQSQNNGFEEGRKEKNQSIYTSYAKDIFCELMHNVDKSKTPEVKDVMSLSISLVKQAKDSFKGE